MKEEATTKRQQVSIVRSFDEIEINNKISEMNKDGWIAVSITSSNAVFLNGSSQQYVIILFEK